MRRRRRKTQTSELVQVANVREEVQVERDKEEELSDIGEYGEDERVLVEQQVDVEKVTYAFVDGERRSI